MDVYCLQEARWRGQGARFLGRYKLWWSGNSDGTGGVGVLVKEELCEKVVESGRTAAEKDHFYDDLRSEWDLHSVGELVLSMGDFNGHVGKRIEGYENVHGRNGTGKRNVEGKMLLKGKRGK
ncbi:uncharacterized protein [Acropora muricata]|uniref:uncharacterized protein n=1 Tax=Acropora muricata TaxID=159855 RepID=UPI0034E5E256